MRTDNGRAHAHGPRTPSRFKLVVLDGPDRGADFVLRGPVARVGRGSENDAVLSDARVSRRHLEIRTEGGEAYVVDRGSRNRTLLNGRPVAEEMLRPGDRIVCGDTELIFLTRTEPGASLDGVARERTTQGLRVRGFGAAARMVGSSAALREVLALVDRLALTDSTLLIQGEWGPGKELAAAAIHAGSERRGGPFICVNCGALPEGLVESELFGHVRGAFTGADRDRVGTFGLADGGTLFLDEVGELSAACQVKLLRVLEDGVITPVGGARPQRIDARVVAATHRDLPRAVREGSFRDDLY
jgi:transcriptional regulator of acetoin/glycerol metabolism